MCARFADARALSQTHVVTSLSADHLRLHEHKEAQNYLVHDDLSLLPGQTIRAFGKDTTSAPRASLGITIPPQTQQSSGQAEAELNRLVPDEGGTLARSTTDAHLMLHIEADKAMDDVRATGCKVVKQLMDDLFPAARAQLKELFRTSMVSWMAESEKAVTELKERVETYCTAKAAQLTTSSLGGSLCAGGQTVSTGCLAAKEDAYGLNVRQEEVVDRLSLLQVDET